MTTTTTETTTTIELTEPEIRERDMLIRGVADAFNIIGFETRLVGAYGDVLRAAGVDPVHAEIGSRWFGNELTFYGQIRSTFRTSTDVGLTLTLDDGSWRVAVEVKWASGGGSVAGALAQAEHQLAVIKRAAAAEETLREASYQVRCNRKRIMDAAGAFTLQAGEAAHRAIKAHRAATGAKD